MYKDMFAKGFGMKKKKSFTPLKKITSILK